MLKPFVSTTQKHENPNPRTREIDPISGADVDPELGHAAADGLAVTEQPALQAPHTNQDGRRGLAVG